MRFLLIFLIISLFSITFYNCQNLVGNIISVSINQPCTNIDASLTNSTSNTFSCNLASIVQLGVSPGFSNESSSITYTFRAFPGSTGTYQQDFDANVPGGIDPDTICDNPGSAQCVSAVQNDNLFDVTISLKPIPIRWNLVPTGLTIPIDYYFQTRPYGINSESPIGACGIDPYSDQTNDPSSPYNYAKPTNTIMINKNNITDLDGSQVYAQYLLSAYSLSVPGSGVEPPNACSDPTQTCTMGLTSVGPQGEISNLYCPTGYNILDTTFNRWLNGTLGAGQAMSFDRLYGNQITSGDLCAYLFNSAEQCTIPINSGGTNDNQYTTNVCPGNPLPNFKQRNNQLYPSYCVNGPCGGMDEPFCALVAGFQFGFSRCMMSREAATEFLINAYNQGVAPACTPSFVTSSPYFTVNIPGVIAEQWFNCLQQAYAFYLTVYPDASDDIRSFSNATNPLICGAYLQDITKGAGASAVNPQACPYPNIFHDFSISSGNHECLIPLTVDAFNTGSNPWTESVDAVNDVRQLVVPFLPYDSTNLTVDIPVGFCGASDAISESSIFNREISPPITTSPCPCTGMNGWQDTVIPIGPLCVVYALENPGEPVYQMEIVVNSQASNVSQCTINLGPVSGPDGGEVLSGACNDTVAAFILNVDKPRGNIVPSLDGYIVICGIVENDEMDGEVNVESIWGGGDITGQSTPWDNLGDKKQYRTPLPSTMRDMFAQGVPSGSGQVPNPLNNTDCTKDSLGNCAWWYYVPLNEINQFCESCNCNGWMNYGVYSTTSTTTMCENRPGTCVPGYDVREYNAKRYDKNITDSLDGFPEKFPTTKTPLFVARQFVDFEIEKGALPQNLPPNWDPINPNYWIEGGYLYSNFNYFSNGNIFIRVELDIAGELLAESTSFSGGQFCYPLQTPTSQYACGVASENPNNQPVGACSVYVNGGGGTLFTVVHNTGNNAGTYTILGNCTNGASLQAPFDFSVGAGQYETVNIPLDYSPINASQVTCSIGLYVAFTEFRLDTIDYVCAKYENKYDAPGTQVYGTENISNAGGVYNPPYHSANAGDGCDGGNPPWYCSHMRGVGGIMSWFWSLLFLVLLILFMIVGFSTIDRFTRRQGQTEAIKSLRERKVLTGKVVETDNLIKATKEEKEIGEKIEKKAEEKEELIERLSGK